MDKVSGLEFIGFNFVPECTAWVSKYFTYYVLDFAESGELDLIMDRKDAVRLKGPVVWPTFPGPYFEFGRRDGGHWFHRFVSFHGPKADGYAREGLFPINKPVITITDPRRHAASFDSLLDRLKKSGGKADFRTVHMLEELLIQLQEQPPAPSSETAVEKKIRFLTERVSETPLKDHDWEKEARDAGLSYPHFRRIFLSQTGMPPAKFAMTKRLAKSAEMLRDGRAEIAEIAEICGFYDIYHFSKMFKKQYGLPPAAWRKNQSVS
jgi:AraC-like DNA-binding protein